MKLTRHVTAFLLLNALMFSLAYGHAPGGQGHDKSQGGAKANSRMSNKGNADTDTQWSADPERGWIRAGERRAHTPAKQNQGKQKSHGEKAKKK